MKVIGFAGWSGSGKTTLVEQVIGLLEARGLVISLIKHAHHDFDIDYPGKDSWRHRHAGCREVLKECIGAVSAPGSEVRRIVDHQPLE